MLMAIDDATGHIVAAEQPGPGIAPWILANGPPAGALIQGHDVYRGGAGKLHIRMFFEGNGHRLLGTG